MVSSRFSKPDETCSDLFAYNKMPTMFSLLCIGFFFLLFNQVFFNHIFWNI